MKPHCPPLLYKEKVCPRKTKLNYIASNLMEGGAEKKRKRENKKKKKGFECDGKEEGCHGRSVEVSGSVMGLFSEFAFIGSGSSSGGTGHASSIRPSIKKFEKKEEAQKKKRKVSPTTRSPSSRKLFDTDQNGFISAASCHDKSWGEADR